MIDPIDRNTALGITEECAKSLKWILSDEDLSESERKECEWKLSFVESIISDLKNVPSIAQRPEPCDDARADVYYLAEKIGIHRLYALVVELRGEPEPCEDAVSRKAVYEAMVEKGQHSRRYRLGETWELNGTEIREALDTVSPVTPKRKE